MESLFGGSAVGQRFRSLVLLLVLAGVVILVGFSISPWGRETPEIEPPSAIPGVRGRVRVEVLNAGGVPGVALDATRALRDQGFDVVLFGNAGTYSDDVSVVLDRVGQIETARLVAEALGVSQFRSEPDSTLFVDVTVRLGPEWTGPRSMVEGTEESAEPESRTSSGS
ncbi:MAG: LytR family transcriptional regulator [Gemmatimonadales bacterium]|nr:MAG: LytR family transcriptional regulator [Gemmatimonadales bacterium]